MTEKSAATLERDAERVRADIAETAESLRGKMSPGQMMDEVVDYLKDGDVSQMVHNFKHQVRDNPLALALIGGGLAWLMMGQGAQPPGSNHPARRPHGEPSAHPRGASGNGASAAAQPAAPSSAHADRPSSGKTTSGVASSLGDGVSSVKESAQSAAGKVSAAAGSAAEATSHAMHDMTDSASAYLGDASQAGGEMGERMKSSFLEALEREPLVMGALGVAVGAAIGAMMPVTRTERENLGEASQSMRKAAESALSEGVEKAKGVAGDVYGAARDEADRQGLTSSGKPLAEKVSAVSKAAGAKAKQATERTLDDAERSVDRATDDAKPTRQSR
jgi:hypothetical protein